MFSILKKNNFRYYFIADLVSSLGTGMSLIGVNWFIIDITSSNESVAQYMGLQILFILLFLPVSGAIADKYSKIRVLFLSNLLRGVAILLTAFVYWRGGSIGIIYFLAIINGIGWAFYIPASRGLVQQIIGKEDYIKGNSLLEISLQIGFFTAAGLAGFIYKEFGILAILLFDATTFVLSAMLMLKISELKIENHCDIETSFFQQISEGLKYLSNSKGLLLFGLIMFIPSIVTIVSNMVLPGYVSEHLNATSIEFGITDMLYGVGALLSGLVAERATERYNKNNITLLLFTVSSLSLAMLFINSSILALMIMYFIFGFSNTLIRILMNSTAMELVPNRVFGRVYSVWNSLSFMMQIFILMLLGRLLDNTSVNYGFLVLSVIMFLTAITYYAFITYVNISSKDGSINDTEGTNNTI